MNQNQIVLRMLRVCRAERDNCIRWTTAQRVRLGASGFGICANLATPSARSRSRTARQPETPGNMLVTFGGLNDGATIGSKRGVRQWY